MHGRLAALLTLTLAMFAPNSVLARSPEVPGTGGVIELEHVIELSAAPEGATLYVARTLFNAGVAPAQVELPIPLPCTATLDEVAIEERDEQGQARRRAAELLDVDDAAQRWSTWLDGPGEGVVTVVDADTALHLERTDYNDCAASLSIYPIPPLHERKVWYRVFVPSRYVEGRHEIDLPRFDEYGEIAKLTLAGVHDDEFHVEVDGTPLGEAGMALVGDSEHLIALQHRDVGHSISRAVDLDVPSMIANLPAAAARLEPDEVPHRLLAATFEAPRELASLPPARRVVVLLDSSHSLEAWPRQELQRLGAAYLEELSTTPGVEAEIVLFDRKLRRIYHDFVPAAWAAEDLRDLEVDTSNGSNLDTALDGARELLAEPTELDGADWILVLGDLYLRSSFPLTDQLDAAAHSAARMHVVRPDESDEPIFHPGAPDEAWSRIAREAGGMLWYADTDHGEIARELVRPMRIWSLRLDLALVGGERREVALADWHAAGEPSEWLDAAHSGPALERASFIGEVWGQRRAWTATPSDDEARRVAGRLATQDDQGLSPAVRTALANHAQVVSPFTSAWALASFAGPPEAPTLGFGTGGLSGRSISTSCGGGFGSGYGRLFAGMTIEGLLRDALASCPDAKKGKLAFESTQSEIVDVRADDPCVREQVWAIDLVLADITTGRRVIEAEYEGTRLLATPSETQLGYLDLTMPTPNITTNTASGMK